MRAAGAERGSGAPPRAPLGNCSGPRGTGSVRRAPGPADCRKVALSAEEEAEAEDASRRWSGDAGRGKEAQGAEDAAR